MSDFFQALEDAFPLLKSHHVGLARLLLVALALAAIYGAKGLRKRICQPLLSKLHERIFVTSRWLYVYQDSQTFNDWKYYTSEAKGKANTGDDLVWTLVSWPQLKPKDSFTLSGVVGMVDALHQSQAKLFGRWNIVHDPDRQPIGPIPARGLKSNICRGAAIVLKIFASI